MIITGDSLDELKKLKPNSIDAVVTDPPYGLSFMGKKWDYDVPSVELWREVYRVLKPGGHVLSFGGTRTYHRLVMAIEDAGFEIRDQIQWLYGSGFPKSQNVGKVLTKQGHDGATYEGYGTALKPANEPICVARKPLEKGLTVAANVLKWGTGALNIDASRVEYQSEQDKKLGQSARPSKTSNANEYSLNHGGLEGFDRSDRSQISGRWPANVILDEQAAAVLDEQTQHLHGAGKARLAEDGTHSGGDSLFGKIGGPAMRFGDSGGASRFFYVAKASKRERNAGMQELTNGHPTVKPVKLMEYLIKLVTPAGGVVLDPFMGSGTTGVAAKKLGFKFIGIELNREYAKIAKKRIGA